MSFTDSPVKKQKHIKNQKIIFFGGIEVEKLKPHQKVDIEFMNETEDFSKCKFLFLKIEEVLGKWTAPLLKQKYPFFDSTELVHKFFKKSLDTKENKHNQKLYYKTFVLLDFKTRRNWEIMYNLSVPLGTPTCVPPVRPDLCQVNPDVLRHVCYEIHLYYVFSKIGLTPPLESLLYDPVTSTLEMGTVWYTKNCLELHDIDMCGDTSTQKVFEDIVHIMRVLSFQGWIWSDTRPCNFVWKKKMGHIRMVDADTRYFVQCSLPVSNILWLNLFSLVVNFDSFLLRFGVQGVKGKKWWFCGVKKYLRKMLLDHYEYMINQCIFIWYQLAINANDDYMDPFYVSFYYKNGFEWDGTRPIKSKDIAKFLSSVTSQVFRLHVK